MRSRGNHTVAMHFLIYTRSASFDYQWVYGLDDKSAENALLAHILKWLNTNLLAKLPPVTTFFRFQRYCALMLAEESDTRTDPQERPIFQRAIFLWDVTDDLYYRHLEPLAIFLGEEAQKIYNELPDDVYRLQSKIQQYNVDIRTLDEEASKINIKKCHWDLPEYLTWHDVIKDKLTVEVPNSWSFDKMIAGPADQPISQSDMIFIGNSLYAENRFPPNQSWLVSAKEAKDNSDNLIRVLKSDGRLLQAVELKQYQGKKKTAASSVSRSNPLPSVPDKSSPLSYEELGVYGDILGLNRPQEKTHESAENDTTEVERLFSEFANSTSSRSKPEGGITRAIKKLLERDHSSVIDIETQILLLLTPAAQSISSDIIVSWHYLLHEILLSYQHPSKEMLDEWIRRIDQLREITIKNLSRPQEKWRAEFSNMCYSLRTTLQSLQ